MAYNLIAVLKDIATRIGAISVPSTGSNIDGVATAINNKTIPDNRSNITAVANAIVSMAGGKDLDDLITILTTMNGNIANLGSNHIVTISEAPGSSTGYYYILGNGNTIPLPNQASKTSYTDTNSIGATDVQGAVDFITKTNSTTGFIKTKQKSITTNSNAVAPLDEWVTDVTILSLYLTNALDIPLLFQSGNSWYVKVINWGSSTYQPMANTTYTINVVYVENN